MRGRRTADDPLFTELIATRMILLNLVKPFAIGQVVTPEDFTRISATVRSDKRKVAQEIQQQYSKATPGRTCLHGRPITGLWSMAPANA